MSGPACIDREIWQGDDSPALVWGFGPDGASEIPAGAQFRLEISWLDPGPFAGAGGQPASGAMTAASPSGGLTVDVDAGTVTWAYTVAQSVAIPRGAVARYQLRCLYAGTTQTWAWGRLRARGAALAA